MPKADRVLSTSPTNTPISQVDATSRRRFLTNAAGVTAGGSVLALATIPPALAANAPAGSPDPIPAAIDDATDPAFAVIAEKLAADAAHDEAIDVQAEAESRYGFSSEETTRRPSGQPRSAGEPTKSAGSWRPRRRPALRASLRCSASPTKSRMLATSGPIERPILDTLYSITARLDAQQADLKRLADQVAGLSAKVETMQAATSSIPAQTPVAPIAAPVPLRNSL